MKTEQVKDAIFGSTFVYPKLLWFKTVLEGILKNKESKYYNKYIDSQLKEYESKLTETQFKNLKRLTKNSLNYYLASSEIYGARSLSLKMFVNLTIRTSLKVMESIGGVVGFQPINGPVGQIFNLGQGVESAHGDLINIKTKQGAELLKASGAKIHHNVFSKGIEAKTEKMMARWNRDNRYELEKTWGINVEDELVEALSNEFNAEVTSSVVKNMLDVAKPSTYSMATWATSKDNIKNLVEEIKKICQESSGNFIITSPMVIVLLQMSGELTPDINDTHEFRFYSGLMYAGKLFDNIKVYSYLWDSATSSTKNTPNSDRILIGYKGINDLSASYIYAPYALASPTSVTMNAATFTPETGFITRAGHEIDSDYYRVIEITDLSFC